MKLNKQYTNELNQKRQTSIEKRISSNKSGNTNQKAGNTKVIILCMVLIILGIVLSGLRTIVNSYFGCFASNSSDAEEAMIYNEGLVFSEDERSSLLVVQEQWDLYKLSHLWDNAQITADDGTLLQAKFYDAGSDITVICLHRFHSDSEGDFLSGTYLGEKGYNIVLLDARAHGESGGEYVSYGYYEQYDLANWIEWADSIFGIDEKIILYGEGMGANTAIMAEEHDLLPDNVAFIILESPYTSLKDIAKYTLPTFYKLPSGIATAVLGFKLNHSDAGFTVEDVDIMTDIGDADVPAIFLAGTLDDYIPYDLTKQVYEAYGGKKAMISDDVRHNLVSATKRTDIKDTIDTYVETYCK